MYTKSFGINLPNDLINFEVVLSTMDKTTSKCIVYNMTYYEVLSKYVPQFYRSSSQSFAVIILLAVPRASLERTTSGLDRTWH